MPAKQVLDILKRSEEYHRLLSAHYQRLSEIVQREEVKRGLEYLSTHERETGERIRAYEADAPANVSATWVSGDPLSDLPKLLEEAGMNPDLTVEEMARMAAVFDESIMQLFRQLAETSAPERLREALEAVLNLEEERKRRMLDGMRDL